VAGPYSSPSPALRKLNILDAITFGQKVRALGFIPLVPHVTILPVEPTEAGYELAMRECFELIRRCDALIPMPTWRKSPGATREREYAESLGMPVFEDLAALQEVADAVA
jgi:hypothetical protein